MQCQAQECILGLPDIRAVSKGSHWPLTAQTQPHVMKVSSLFAKGGKSYNNFECQVVQLKSTIAVCTSVVSQWTVLNRAININYLGLFRFFVINILYINKL